MPVGHLVHNPSHEYYPLPVCGWTLAWPVLHLAENFLDQAYWSALAAKHVPSPAVFHADQAPVTLPLPAPCSPSPVFHSVLALMLPVTECHIVRKSELSLDFENCNPRCPSTTSPWASILPFSPSCLCRQYGWFRRSGCQPCR